MNKTLQAKRETGATRQATLTEKAMAFDLIAVIEPTKSSEALKIAKQTINTPPPKDP